MIEVLFFTKVVCDLISTGILSSRVAESRHHIPGSPPVAHMVYGRELARQLVGCVVRGREGRSQPDLLGHGRQRGEQCDSVGASIDNGTKEASLVLTYHQTLTEEDKVELAALSGLCK